MTDPRLLRIVLYLHQRLERAQKLGGLPLSLSQYRLLNMIKQGPARSVELATASGMTKPSIGSLVSQLEEGGWIERQEIETDRRAASIRITTAGKKALARFEAALQESIEQFLGADAVARADGELDWLYELMQVKREEAHEAWALRRSESS